jgi:hypothetical protein
MQMQSIMSVHEPVMRNGTSCGRFGTNGNGGYCRKNDCVITRTVHLVVRALCIPSDVGIYTGRSHTTYVAMMSCGGDNALQLPRSGTKLAEHFVLFLTQSPSLTTPTINSYQKTKSLGYCCLTSLCSLFLVQSFMNDSQAVQEVADTY